MKGLLSASLIGLLVAALAGCAANASTSASAAVREGGSNPRPLEAPVQSP